MKERWTLEVELDVEEFSGVQHQEGTPFCQIQNTDDGLMEAFPDGLHWHAHMGCYIMLPWTMVKREPAECRQKEPSRG